MIKKIQSIKDIPMEYKDSPISRLLEYHNFQSDFHTYNAAELLIGTCMDFRIMLNIPEKFAYIIRTGGANLNQSEFHIAFALSVAKVKHMAIIGHTDCGMVNLDKSKQNFVHGLVHNAGWDEGNAERFFNHYSRQFEIENENIYTLKQVNHFRKRFPEIVFVPMIYNVDDHKLSLLQEE